jgi:ParB-like chromosome segregation protein Spo0J
VPQQWNNRIVGHEDVPVEKIVANNQNWRTHATAQASVVRDNLEEIGIVKSSVVNLRTGKLIDGHLRLKLALEKGQKTIPVEYVDLSPEEEGQALATLDSSSEMAGTDQAKLKELLDEFTTKSPAIQGMLDDLAEEAGLKDELLEADIEEMKILPPPQLVWVLLAIPIRKFGSVRDHLVALESEADISVQSNRDR